MKIIEIVEKILAIGERQFAGERKTATFIKDFLRKNNIEFKTQNFFTLSPKIKKAELKIGNSTIDCEATGFISGTVNTKLILNSLESSQLHLFESNINSNPACKSVSLSNFYFAPSIAIKNTDKRKIQTKNVVAEIKVTKKKYQSENILVGNMKNPVNIFFGHYDSIKTGAIDNASGIGVMLKLVLDRPELLFDSLFCFCGNEELSYDKPIYWGHGYRVFEKKYFTLLKRCSKILVVDCVGNGKTIGITDKNILIKAFPIKNIRDLADKIIAVSGNIPKLMKVYHSNDDTIKQLDEKFLQDTLKFIVKETNS